MIILSVSALSFRVGTKEILNNINFAVEEGDRVGIVGINGSGKSTLLAMIAGNTEPSDGAVYIAKDRILGMMEQNDAFNVVTGDTFDSTVLSQMYAAYPGLCRDEARLSELEELMKHSCGAELERYTEEFSGVNTRFIDNGGLHYKSRCRSLLSKLGFSEDYFNAEISSLSGGERERLNIARLLFREPDILILDEPTNHLDTDTMEWLEGVLASYKKTLLVVSHDRYFLDRVTTKTLDVENHGAKLYGAPYSGYIKLKEEYRKAAEKKYDLQQKEIARLEAYIEQQRRWNRERNIIAAESREKAIARMEKVERPADEPKSIRFGFTKNQESGNDVLSVRSLSMKYPAKTLFEDISFEVKKREHLFICGANGTGQSTLLKILLKKI
ncbi:MAG: ABC-F family ATP-binding cassette domain-containing protein, partial [Clostridia bacterium]|nr:ABC-F family ATP-binding cassette domain-containing protein [Clostridia bacterium]